MPSCDDEYCGTKGAKGCRRCLPERQCPFASTFTTDADTHGLGCDVLTLVRCMALSSDGFNWLEFSDQTRSQSALPDQALQILAMLLERPGEIITREQLIARLWPNGTTVEFDHEINSSVRRLGIGHRRRI
jgi:Transcriptional regulatory protein, C terminal